VNESTRTPTDGAQGALPSAASSAPSKPAAPGPGRGVEPRLLDRVRTALRLRHRSLRTEKAYVHWIRRFILFHDKRHPAEMGPAEITAFLNHLAVVGGVSASTQNQALNAIAFLYHRVLAVELPALEGLVRARTPRRLPVVLGLEEVRALLSKLDGVPHLVASLLYGAGLRLLEALTLRVKDLDFATGEIRIRDGKGRKDRVTTLPAACVAPLQAQLAAAKRLHDRDRTLGFGAAPLPDALARKYPGASKEWAWQYVFPATSRWRDPVSGAEQRHHLHETVVQRAVHRAVREAGIAKPASCHTLRHSFPRTCSPAAMTSAPCRSSSGTGRSRRP
jgi:integron integrase